MTGSADRGGRPPDPESRDMRLLRCEAGAPPTDIDNGLPVPVRPVMLPPPSSIDAGGALMRANISPASLVRLLGVLPLPLAVRSDDAEAAT